MSLYYFPLLIRNDRYFVARLDDDSQPGNREELDFNFVIYAQDRTSTPVLSIENLKNAVINQMRADTIHQDVHLQDCELSMQKLGNDSFELVIKKTGAFSCQAFNDMESGIHFSQHRNDDRVFIHYSSDKVQQQQFYLYVTLEVDGARFSARFLFAIVHSRECHRVVIDFGSEASQVGYKNCHVNTGVIQYDILSNIINTLPAGNWQRNNFLNYEPDDKFLYRSFYAIKKNITDDDKDNFLFRFNDDPLNDAIRLFITRNEVAAINQAPGQSFKDKYIIIPNLKLGIDNVSLHLSFNNRPEDYNISTHKAELISAILLRLLRLMIHTKSDFRKGGLIVTLLVPNLYTQGDIFSLLTELSQQTGRMIASLGIPEGVLHVEYETISESDAAFMGYQLSNSANLSFNNGDISLIIDCGKGTTDISMVLADGNENFSSFFRTGFAGAGNVLTYGFIEDFLTLVLKAIPGSNDASVSNFIKKQILDQNLTTDVLDFLQFIESRKKQYPELDRQSLMDFMEMKENAMNTERTVANLHKDAGNLLQYTADIFKDNPNKIWDIDITGIIHKAIDCICHCIMSSIREAITDDIRKRIKIVILTGRAFYFDALRVQLTNQLKEVLSPHTRIPPMSRHNVINNKSVAIYGAFSGAYKITDFTGIPIDRKEGLRHNKALFDNNLYLYEGLKIQPDNDIIYNAFLIRRNNQSLRRFKNNSIDIYFTRDHIFIRRMENQQVKYVISLESLIATAPGTHMAMQDLKRISMFPGMNEDIDTIDHIHTRLHHKEEPEIVVTENKRTILARLFNMI